MAYDKAYDNTNSGLLAKNDRKEKDTHPDYSGSINVEGVEYWLKGWIKVGREDSKLAGQKYFSLSVSPKDAPQSSRAAPRQAARPSSPSAPTRQAPAPSSSRGGGGFDDMADDIPF
ncbi:hypothetical protein UFOVP1298_34 [uncultured Caudovirales phage]|uniref:Single-stranded DNA-binding protein n=1 Tax=uncultured Caudovirales phage TaxID=2100421 RepID=A0A6J5RUP9_9CAUD|nr:hypothetical protein UFOVP1298_34 [uncultured Caudovirales phage]